MNRQRTLMLCVACFVAGWVLSSGSPARPPSPFSPGGNDRPVLYFLAKAARVAARLGLVALSFAESPDRTQQKSVDKMVFDAEGHPVVDHAEGW